MRLGILLAATIMFAGQAVAQETAQAWMSRLHTVVDKPIDVKQEMTRDAKGTTITTKTSFLMADDSHFRMATEQTMEGPDGNGGTVKQSILLENVADGKWMWMKFTDPVSGQGQVRKVGLNEMAAKAKEAGSVFTETHPAGFIVQLCELVEFEDVVLEKETVTLKGTFTEDAKSKLIEGFRGGIPRDLTLVLNRQTAFPMSFEVKSYHKSLVSCSFSEVRFLDPKKIDMKLFKFEQPKGLQFQEPAPAPQKNKSDKK